MARLIMAIVSTLLEEIALVVILLWTLPEINIRIPLPAIIVLMVAWAALSVVIYQIGSRALKMKALISLPDMVGCRGKVVSPLTPEGLVRIKSELWIAKSTGGEMETGEKVIVVEQSGLKLVVQNSGTAHDLGQVQ